MTQAVDAALAFDPIRLWLVARRKEFGFSALHVARKIGVKPDLFRAWEKGVHVPTYLNHSKWCRALRADAAVIPWEDAE